MYVLKELGKRVVAKVSEGQSTETKKRKAGTKQKSILLFKSLCCLSTVDVTLIQLCSSYGKYSELHNGLSTILVSTLVNEFIGG